MNTGFFCSFKYRARPIHAAAEIMICKVMIPLHRPVGTGILSLHVRAVDERLARRPDGIDPGHDSRGGLHR
jgi:hypothetical protein